MKTVNKIIQPKTNKKQWITKNTSKERYDGHSSTFNNRDKSGKTTLAAHIWKLKDRGSNYNLSLSIIEKGKSFNPSTSTRRCNLCLKEI